MARKKKIKCGQCEKLFIPFENGAGRKYCSIGCSAEHNREATRLRYHRKYKDIRELKKKEEVAPVQQEIQIEKKKPESIAEIQRKARASGLSYGQYVLRAMQKTG